MKKIALILLCGVLALSACKKDEECVAPDLADNIVGTWKVALDGNSVEFQTDGTLIDPNDALIGGEINGTVLNEKTYEVLPMDSLYLRAASGALFIEATLPVTRNECDVVTLDIVGFSANLNRE